MKKKNIRIPPRVKIVKWLEEIRQDYQNNIFFYNPRYTIEEFGNNLAIDDTAHYSESFKPILAQDIYSKFLKDAK